jgi:hypothetical protein
MEQERSRKSLTKSEMESGIQNGKPVRDYILFRSKFKQQINVGKRNQKNIQKKSLKSDFFSLYLFSLFI